MHDGFDDDVKIYIPKNQIPQTNGYFFSEHSAQIP